MKKVVIFCAKLRMYLSEIPLIIIFAASIYLNGTMENLVKLYPLIIVSGAGIIMTFLFLFRICVISVEEIKSMGLFSSHDSAIINKDKTLILTLHKHRKLKIALFGNDGTAPELDWLKGDDYVPMDIYLYRESAVGGKGTVRRVLKYFDVPSNDIDELLSVNGGSKDYENITVTGERREDVFEVRIKFRETI